VNGVPFTAEIRIPQEARLQETEFSFNLVPYHQPMTIAGHFITDLQREQKIGHVSSETEQHLKHEFRKLGGSDASHTVLAATLRRLREGLLGVV
jgi:hypothetical protein